MSSAPSGSPAAFFARRNLVTYVSVAFALAAMLVAGSEHGRWYAGAALALAALADILDGRFARLFKASEDEKRFGVQIDSLADAVAFGVAPVVCLARFGAGAGGTIDSIAFFAAALFYVLAALTRLGFYNVRDDATGFVGVPTTVAGILWSAMFLLAPGSWCALPLVVIAALMIAPIALPRPGARTLVTLLVVCVALAAVHLVRSR